MIERFTPEARACIERVAALPGAATRAELDAYADLALLAGKWRKRNTAERVLKKLQAPPATPFTEAR